MKTLYEELEIEVIRFETEDVITTSGRTPPESVMINGDNYVLNRSTGYWYINGDTSGRPYVILSDSNGNCIAIPAI